MPEVSQPQTGGTLCRPMGIGALAALLLGCTPSPSSPGPGLSVAEADAVESPHPGESRILAADNPKILQQPRIQAEVRASLHRYYRLTANNFTARVCEMYAESSEGLAHALLHGDAHVEQFAVVQHGHGLADYDHAGLGPAVIDLLRFATSLRVVAQQRGWSERGDAVVERFLNAYADALGEPRSQRHKPEFVQRCLGEFADNREQFLKEAEALMKPLPAEERKAVTLAFELYSEQVHEAWPSIPESFLTLKALGRASGGVGSSLDRKYLLRVEGPTSTPDDDVILEAKPAQVRSPGSCMKPAHGQAARRVVDAQRAIFGPPPALLQDVAEGGESTALSGYYIQPWFSNFRELNASQEPASFDGLIEIAADVGQQLGKGHFSYEDADSTEPRAKQRDWVKANRARLVQDSAELLDEVNAGREEALRSIGTAP